MSDPLVRALQELLGPQRVLATRGELLVYECDGLTQFKSAPRCAVLPHSTEDVQAILHLLHRERTPFVARGAGTGLSGGAIAQRDAVLIELSRMKQILEIDPVDRIARVEVGVVNAELSKAVKPYGLFYAPDPSSQTACTLGGNAAENSGGPHCLKYGNTTRHMLALEVVLPDGTRETLGDPFAGSAGYDLRGLFIGSEGTLGIATEITVRLCPQPESVVTLLAAFETLDAACRAVSDLIARGVQASAIEILDQRTIDAVESSVFRAGYPRNAGAVLLVELDGPAIETAEDAERVEAIARANHAILLQRAADEEQRMKLWKGRKGAFGAMGRVAPDLYVQDAVVPRTRLPEVVRGIGEICDKYRLRLANVFHAGEGNLHPNIAYDGTRAEEVERVHEAGREIFELCISVGGSLSGEHGIGLEKREFMHLLYSPEDLATFCRVREAFDPLRLANPEKVLPVHACLELRSALPSGERGTR
ncbi:MAG: FAD-binding protein [Planctomycetes bacterium]|nr:FAD-binding protein [Planctomycetota bacterium]